MKESEKMLLLAFEPHSLAVLTANRDEGNLIYDSAKTRLAFSTLLTSSLLLVANLCPNSVDNFAKCFVAGFIFYNVFCAIDAGLTNIFRQKVTK